MKASGRLRHCFHGEYSAIVALEFDSKEDARAARPSLGDDWKVSTQHPGVLRWEGNSEALKALKILLARFGYETRPCGWNHCKDQCQRAEVDSLAHSIDVGPSFTVDVPPGVPEEQASLF
jgi:hypothetical protein